MLNYVINKDIKNKLQTVVNLNEDTNTIELYDTIIAEKYWDDQPGITANEFVNKLSTLKGDITVRINSRGGEVGNALAIYQRLREHNGTVNTIVDGYAYSSAGWIMLAGTNRTINTGGLVMVHNPAMFCEVTKESDFDEIKNQWMAHQTSIINIITDRTKLKQDVVKNMMEKTTFMTANEAIENGFCHSIQNSTNVFNMLKPEVRNAVPEEIKKSSLWNEIHEENILTDRILKAKLKALK